MHFVAKFYCCIVESAGNLCSKVLFARIYSLAEHLFHTHVLALIHVLTFSSNSGIQINVVRLFLSSVLNKQTQCSVEAIPIAYLSMKLPTAISISLVKIESNAFQLPPYTTVMLWL